MARAMTTAEEVRDPRLNGTERVVLQPRAGGEATFGLLLAKNVLVWGSVSLSLYGLYSLFSLF